MIYYLCRARSSQTIGWFLPHVPRALRKRVRVLTYERLFRDLSIRPGHMIFTDMDRLSQFELEIAAATAESVAASAPEAKILNHPARFLQRFELLEMLWHAGVNPFRAARLELPLPALRFPVFIRREGDAEGPESGLLHDQEALADALAALGHRGTPLRGRLAVEYCARADQGGIFRKYGAFRIGDRILPQHIQFSDNWMVKRNSNKLAQSYADEEMAYITQNPHADELLRLTDMAHAQFGRVDYTVIDGRVVIYEVNSNPTFPRGDKNDLRQPRRQVVRERIVKAFTALDTPVTRRARIYLGLPPPRSHDLPGPRFMTFLRLMRVRAERQRLAQEVSELVGKLRR